MDAIIATLALFAFVCGCFALLGLIARAKFWQRGNRNQIVRSMAHFRCING